MPRDDRETIELRLDHIQREIAGIDKRISELSAAPPSEQVLAEIAKLESELASKQGREREIRTFNNRRRKQLPSAIRRRQRRMMAALGQ